MKVKNKIISMLKENTGVHILDSGGAYGRNFELNQNKYFENEKIIDYEVYKQEDSIFNITIQLNVYHYLKNYLILDNDTKLLNNKFTKYCKLQENTYYLQDIENFCQDILKIDYNIVNTYNYDNILSQVLQYAYFNINDDDYIILQIHGGCDVRGGYTKPYIFKVYDYDYFILSQYNVNLICTGKINTYEGGDITKNKMQSYKQIKKACINNWYSDDSGYNWYYNGSTENKKPFNEYVYLDDDNKLRCKDCNGIIDIIPSLYC